MAIHVNNLQDKVETTDEIMEMLREIAQSVLERAGKADSEAGLTLADDEYLRTLNRDYRGLDASTDVLSFAMHETAAEEPEYTETGPDLLGDVVISVEMAAAQAREYGHGFPREMAYLTVHGLLHLLGYGHEGSEGAQIMRAEEEAILAAFGRGAGS